MKQQSRHWTRMRMAVAMPLIVMAMMIVASIGGRRAHGAAPMTTFTVTNLNDSGEGSLRQAILDANANPGADTINFQAGLTGTILLTSGELGIRGEVDITGPGATSLTVSGNNASRVFGIFPGAIVLISGLTISHGKVGMDVFGGGIQNAGRLTITNCTVSDNSGGGGGGIGCNIGTVTIINSTLSRNGAGGGGGISIGPLGSLTIINSTVSDNSALDFGGGGIFNFGTVTIINSTLSDNSATGPGAGILNDGGTFNIKNSIVANSSPGNCANPDGGTFNASGTNFSTDGSCHGFTEVTLLQLKLLPLAVSPPGTTATHALEPGSVAIDAATDGCTDLDGHPVTNDQRGFGRPVDGDDGGTAECDVGAYEAPCSSDTHPPTIAFPTQPLMANAAPGMCKAIVSFTVTATDNCDQSVTIDCQPPSGSEFQKGTTTVNCTATDDNDNMSMCSFSVIVSDNEQPQITCPANITQGSDLNQCGAVVIYPNATATDNCPGVGTPTCLPLSGSFFTVGTTTVTCNVSDAVGNTNSCSFTVTVNDTRPSINCPANQTAVTATVNDPCKLVTFTPTASDNCPGVTVVCTPPSGSCFPVGVTTVTCTATDAASNTTTCSFTVSVFNARLQDDSEGCNNSVLINTLTGDYRWCCGDTIFTGTGNVSMGGNTIKIEHKAADRRVVINLSAGSVPPSGTAILQSPLGTLRCVITDRNTSNDTCICGG